MIVLVINVYELINNKNYLAFFITTLHLLTNSLYYDEVIRITLIDKGGFIT